MLNTVAHGLDANYRVTVRTFPSVVEITARPINHQLELARSRNQGIKGISRNIELDEEERARKDEENLTRSIRRAKQSVRWHVQRLEADHMLTLTYRENMLDVDRLKKDFDHFRRLVMARYPEWKYVAVREQQERGAWHLHLAVKGNQDIKYLRTCWYKVLGCFGAAGADVLGQVNVKASKRRYGAVSGVWKQSKLASYLTKYLHKGFEVLEHASKRYWASKGTVKPVITRYWLGSANLVEMIKDTFDIGLVHGLEDFPSIMQSRDRGVLYLTGNKLKNICFG